MWLKRSNPKFNMGVDVMRPAFNLEPHYRVTMLTREEWTRGSQRPELSFNSTQSRIATCLLTGHNILRRHLYSMGLTDSYTGGLKQRNKLHPMFCASVKLWLYSDKHVWALFFLDSEDVKSLSLGAIWNFNKGTWLPLRGIRLWGTEGRLKA